MVLTLPLDSQMPQQHCRQSYKCLRQDRFVDSGISTIDKSEHLTLEIEELPNNYAHF